MCDFVTSTTQEIDDSYGFRIQEIENALLLAAKGLRPSGNMSNFGEVLHNGHQTWVGLDPETLNTPYAELSEMCDLINPDPDQLVVDLGAGYGKLGLVLHRKFPKARFLGLELVKERVLEGQRIFKEMECSLAQIFEQDLMDSEFRLPVADYYFLYDFGKTEHIRITLRQLEELADKNHHFKVIARGKGSRSIIEHEHPWLSQINDVQTRENYSIYSY